MYVACTMHGPHARLALISTLRNVLENQLEVHSAESCAAENVLSSKQEFILFGLWLQPTRHMYTCCCSKHSA